MLEFINLNYGIILIVLSIAAAFWSLFSSGRSNYVGQRNILREKWMVQIRNTSSKFISVCQHFRLKQKDFYEFEEHGIVEDKYQFIKNQKYQDSMLLYSSVRSLVSKMKFLFNTGSKDGGKFNRLFELMFMLANKKGSKWNQYIRLQNILENHTISVLDRHMDKIIKSKNHWIFPTSLIINTVLIILIFCFWVFYENKIGKKENEIEALNSSLNLRKNDLEYLKKNLEEQNNKYRELLEKTKK